MHKLYNKRHTMKRIPIMNLRLLCVCFISMMFVFTISAQIDRKHAFTSTGNLVFVSDNQQSIIMRDAKTGNETVLLQASERNEVNSFGGIIMSPDDASLLFYENRLLTVSDSAHYYILNIARKRVEPLSEYGKQHIPLYSPSGKMIAFVRQNDLYIKRLEFGTELRVTENGQTSVLSNGMADAIYQQGFGIFSGITWSPDSRMLAYIAYDQSQVPYFSQTDQREAYPIPSSFRYAQPQFPITKTRLFSYNIQFRRHIEMKFPDEEADKYITALQWTSQPDLIGVTFLNREQNERRTLVFNAQSGVSRQVNIETSSHYIAPDAAMFLRFLPDNSFLLLSEKTGNVHVYHHASNGMQIRQLTSGDFNVTKVYGYDNTSKTVFYQSNENGRLNTGIYAVGLNARTRSVAINSGSNDAQFSDDFLSYVHRFASHNDRPIITLRDIRGRVLRTFTHFYGNQPNHNITKKLITIPMDNNETLDAIMLLSPNHAIQQPIKPLIIVLDEVRNDWCVTYADDFAANGFKVVSLSTPLFADNNALKRMQEAITYIRNMPEFSSNSAVIMAKGLYAHTAISLINSNIDAVVAITPITDFERYAAVISERLLGLPQKKFISYRENNHTIKTAPLGAKLLLIHDTENKHIPIGHTWRLVENGLTNNLNIDMMIVPGELNVTKGNYLQPSVIKYITRYLTNLFKM